MSSNHKGGEYTTKDIANIVGIAPPTVRKYSQALEKAGHSFCKNDKGFRIFSEEDLSLLMEIKNMSTDKAMPIGKIVGMLLTNDSEETEQREKLAVEQETKQEAKTEVKQEISQEEKQEVKQAVNQAEKPEVKEAANQEEKQAVKQEEKPKIKEAANQEEKQAVKQEEKPKIKEAANQEEKQAVKQEEKPKIKEAANQEEKPKVKQAVKQEIKPGSRQEEAEILKIIPLDRGNAGRLAPAGRESKGEPMPANTRYDELINKLDMIDTIMQELEELKKANKMLLEKLEEQQEFIKNILNEREKRIIESLKSSMENRHLQKQLEEIKGSLLEVSAGEEKKGFFTRLFNK